MFQLVTTYIQQTLKRRLILFLNTKVVHIKRTSPSGVLQLDVATTLGFYIKEVNQGTVLSSVQYRVDKTDGRNITNLVGYTTITSLSDTYTFDVLVTGVTTKDLLTISFKTVDADGMEFFSEPFKLTVSL